MYRFRDRSGSTYGSLNRMKHLDKIGTPKFVKGYIYFGRYGTFHAGVLVRGSKGSVRFSGFSWGYAGEGVRGLKTLLEKLGVSPDKIQEVITVPWEFPRENKTFWKVDLTPAKVA